MNLSRLTLVSLLFLSLGSRASLAQESSQGQIPRFRAGVDAVLVDALVLDSDGMPVSDLTREDFRVFEDGVEQTIASFDVTDWTSYVAARTGEAPASTSAPAVNTYPRRFVFVLNRQGASFEYLARAKRALSTFVVESLADGDEAMVIDIGYSTKILQDLVDDKQTTISTIKSLSSMAVPYRLGADRAAEFVYEDLEALGRSFAELPGRKILVLFSMELLTFTSPGTVYSSQAVPLQRAIESLNQSNTSVYAIDLAGVDRRGSSPTGGLSPLATDTGGRYFVNAVTYARELERVGRENQRYYLLGYVSTNAAADGSYREIEVRVDRPDVEVIARPGYFAREAEMETTDDGDEARDRSPEGGKARPENALPLAVEMTTYLLPTGTGKVRVPVSIALPEELLTGPGGRERKLTVTLSNEQGETVERFEQDVDVESYYLVRQADLEPGLYTLALELHSDGQELYRASTGIQVPDGFGERFGLSSVIPVVSPERTDDVGNGLPLLPVPSVERGEDAFLLFQVFAGRDEPASRARIGFALLDERDEEILVGGREEPLELSQAPAGTPVVLSIPTRTLDYGRYRVEVRVEDPDDGRRATSDIELRVR